MKKKTISMTTLALLPTAVFTLTSCSSTAPPDVGTSKITYTKGVPGGVIVQTVKMTATVTAIDQAKRTATLLASDGKKFVVKVGPEVVNFHQVRVGDLVNATVTQKIAAHLDKENTASTDGTTAVVARAGEGDQPGGLVAETTQTTGKIIAIDVSKRTATLWFEDGNTQTVPIRKDVELSRFKVGQQVVFRVTDMVAIWVEKP
jgi:translation elongation factor P/translation initiation factor 5A